MEIDFVILWVDGNDPEWIKEKNKYSGHDENENNSENRYRDWGLLPYWFRSVEKFAPWVRMIHFVTWGHVPKFLNIDSPKIHVVRHDEFIPKEYLPTFSSHAIEMNIHRIPGLSEHFVYFNDDMFMLRPFKEDDFFRDNLPCTYGGEVPIELVGNIGTWQHAAVNDLGIVNAHFPKRESVKRFRKKYISTKYRWKDNLRTLLLQTLYPDYFTGFKNLHAPAAYLKSTFEEIWDVEFEKMDSTCRDKFRTSDNVNQWVVLWWQIASGKFMPYIVDNIVQSITEESVEFLSEVVKKQKHQFICINDPDQKVDFEKLSDWIKSSFNELLSDKSQFEK
ncbi:MAG: Stealth CR1 domain-containing protein [Lachnospiraceae bacterium]|nr:Stealth CR1 domain-containing protein [Lachnospiraceae bacterium]